jgi:uncharacterized membrane protein
MLYLVLKFIHIGAVVLFLGNIITGLFWKTVADRTGDIRIMAHTLNGINRSDLIFTYPGIMIIVLAGFATAIVGSIPILRTGWILWGIILFTISGLIFWLRVAPLQNKLTIIANIAVAGGKFDKALYANLSRDWELWGLAAMLTPVGAVLVMVLKPVLPSL